MIYNAKKITTDLTKVTQSSWGGEIYKSEYTDSYLFYATAPKKLYVRIAYADNNGYYRLVTNLKDGDIVKTDDAISVYSVPATVGTFS